jgi:peptide-methionine (S)-S-oxide reductase
MIVMGLAALWGAACDRPTVRAADLPAPKADVPGPEDEAEHRFAVFAGGCFWCVEAVFQPLAGVESVVSGYAGGTAETASYELVSTGQTKHAEVVGITYDPAVISYAQLLRVFFTTHDPTTLNRQGPDRGPQYRSAIFYGSDDEKRVAEAYIAQLNEAEVFKSPIVTTLEALADSAFYPAEAYHQDFVRRNPNHPYVRQWALPKVDKVRTKFGDLLAEPTADPTSR